MTLQEELKLWLNKLPEVICKAVMLRDIFVNPNNYHPVHLKCTLWIFKGWAREKLLKEKISSGHEVSIGCWLLMREKNREIEFYSINNTWIKDWCICQRFLTESEALIAGLKEVKK